MHYTGEAGFKQGVAPGEIPIVSVGRGLQIVLTLLGKDTRNVALPPLKVVLTTTPGQ